MAKPNRKRTRRKKKGKYANKNTNIRALVRQEIRSNRVLKYIDAILGATSVTASGTTAALVNIPQGYAQSQRIGDAVEIVKIHLTAFTMTAANADVYSHTRFIFYRWKENIADTAPTVALILQTPTTNSCFSALNYDNKLLYRVCWDKTFSLTGTATVPTDKSDHYLTRIRIPPKGKRLQYRAASSSASTDTMCILYISDSAASPFPVMTFNFRIWYYDA
jgi:hypothetical protein